MADRPALRPALLRPPALRQGDTIALVAPSRPGDPERVGRARVWLEERGYRVRCPDSNFDRYHYLAGRDEARAAGVMDAFLDGEVAALLCVRGGYGTGRMIDRIDYETVARHPKVVIGFSDSTGLHLALHARTGLVVFTGALADSDFGRRPVDALVDRSLWRLVEHTDPAGPVTGDNLRLLRPGVAEGPLVPANLALLSSLVGTPFVPDLDGAVLLLEDVTEAPYRIDRMLTQLRLAGLLDRIAGLALGSFHGCFDPTDMEDSPTLEEIVDDVLGDRDLPVVSGLAYGHTRRRTVLPIGVRARIDADGVTLLEGAVC